MSELDFAYVSHIGDVYSSKTFGLTSDGRGAAVDLAQFRQGGLQAASVSELSAIAQSRSNGASLA